MSFIHADTKVSCVKMTWEWQPDIDFSNSKINGRNNNHILRELVSALGRNCVFLFFIPTGTGVRQLVESYFGMKDFGSVWMVWSLTEICQVWCDLVPPDVVWVSCLKELLRDIKGFNMWSFTVFERQRVEK